MRRILVTGGAGFIGCNFIHFWIGRHPEDEITNVDKLTYAGNVQNLKTVESHPAYSFIRGDICDVALIQQLFRDKRIDTVVHFAAESHVDRSILGPGDFVRTNVEGTCTLLEAARQYWANGASGNAFLHVSTDEVYGSLGSDEPAFKETTPYAPRSPYSASKAASDHLVRAYYHTHGLPVLVTHCSNNYGPYQFPEKLMPLVIQRALARKPIPVYGDGENIRDWIYVIDHCAALETVLQKGRIGETYDIGGGNQWKNIDLVNLVCDLLDQKLGCDPSRRSLVQFVADRPGHDRRYATDAAKITRELGWRPKETLPTGIAKTIDWYLSHPDWVEGVLGGDYARYFDRQYGTRIRNMGGA